MLALGRELMPETMRLLTAPLEAARRAGRLRMGVGITRELVGLTFQPADPPSALRGPLGATKQAAWTDAIPLAEVKATAAALGGTVNDVLLAAMTGAFRAYMTRRAGAPPRRELRAAVPVSLRPPEELAALGNRFGLLFVDLPVAIADPVERFHELRRRAERLKRSAAPWATLGFLRALGHLPASWQRWAVRFFGSKATAVMTNVPGPKRRLYIGGQPIHEIFFWVPQSGRAGIGVSILSYAGDVRVGIATDQGLVPDPETLVQDLYRELDALRAARDLVPAASRRRRPQCDAWRAAACRHFSTFTPLMRSHRLRDTSATNAAQQDGGEEPTRQGGSQEQRQAVCEIADPGHLDQEAQHPGQEARLRDEVAVNQKEAAGHEQGQAEALPVGADRQACQSLELRLGEGFEGGGVPQREQHRDEIPDRHRL